MYEATFLVCATHMEKNCLVIQMEPVVHLPTVRPNNIESSEYARILRVYVGGTKIYLLFLQNKGMWVIYLTE